MTGYASEQNEPTYVNCCKYIHFHVEIYRIYMNTHNAIFLGTEGTSKMPIILLLATKNKSFFFFTIKVCL